MSMMKLAAASAFALALGIAGANAQTSGSTTGSGSSATGATGQQMSSAECQTLWNTLDASKSGSVTQTQAQTHVTDFKSADSNNDGRLSSTEFQTACQRGMVKSTGATGAGTGTSGAGTTGSGSDSTKK